jgi:hypothetical protein
MARLRFETVRDVFDAFPIAQHELSLEPNDEPSLQFLQALVSRDELDKAVGFCAFLLPRREAVWWGCRSVKTLVPARSEEEEQAITVAEQWVREPEEERRLAALELGVRGSSKLPSTYLALAAGWSGGRMNVGADEAPVPIPPHQTARVVRAAVLIAACRVEMAQKPELLRLCLEDGIQIASDETQGV